MPYTLEWLRNARSYSSAHVLFARNGDVHELVAHNKRPWSSGRFNKPSLRGKRIMKKDWKGKYIKPGHYLLQCEFECLLNQTFSVAQYKSAIQYFKDKLDFEVNENNLLEHQDTAIGKPEMQREWDELLKQLHPPPSDTTGATIRSGDAIEFKVDNKKLIINKI
jgi:N-acetyl-anhydromuramyl-L-alanine amidase AmpD